MARVLIAGFCTVPGPTRVGVQLRHVIRALGRNHSVDVLLVRTGDQPYVERMGGVRLLRVPTHDTEPKQQINTFRRALCRQLEGAEYDVVHFRDGWSGIPTLELRERLKYAAVFDAARAPMSEPQLHNLEMSAELVRDEEACLLGADLVLAPTEPARRYIAARGRPDRVHMVPPGVDVDRFDYDRMPTEGPPAILYVGALSPGRGVRILLRAMLDIVNRTDARLVLAGPRAPGFDKTLRAGIADLNLGGVVELVGAVDHEDVPNLIARATVCVAPAAVELSPKPTALYPTKILEYMACQRAVVAPRRGSVTMFMKDRVHGLLYTPGDPSDLARKVLRLMEDNALRATLAGKGYELVRAGHTASKTRRCLRDAYLSLAELPRWRDRLSSGTTSPVSGVPIEISRANITTELHDQDLVEAGVDLSDEGSGAATAIATTAGDLTTVDGVKWADRTGTEPNARPDDWVVGANQERLDPAPRFSELGEDEEEGTPVDIRPTRGLTPPLETRFVAGEMDVPTPPPEPEDGETLFTAVSVLLGSTAEDTDGRGAKTPTMPRSPAPDRGKGKDDL